MIKGARVDWRYLWPSNQFLQNRMEGQSKFFKEYSNLRRRSQFQPSIYDDNSTLKQQNMKPKEEESKGISISWKITEG